MYNAATGIFECSPTVQVTLHSARNPHITQLQGSADFIPTTVNLSLSHNRSPLPLGPFAKPTFLHYMLATGAGPLPCIKYTPFMTSSPPPVPVIRMQLHACSPPTTQGSGMQQCSLSSPALPILNAILTSPLGPYTKQLMVFSKSVYSLLPPFASSDGNTAATVRIGHSTCDIVAASDAIPHADLNDFGVGGGYLQVLRLKTFIPSEMIMSKQYTVSDAAISSAGAVLTTSSDAVAKLLKVGARLH
jgi:hypothetical protein